MSVEQVAAPVPSRSSYQASWRRRKKEASRTPEQREAHQLAELIKSVSSQYPSLKSEINEFLYVLHQRVNQTPDRVRDGIIQAIKQGCYTIEDICEETHFQEMLVVKTLEGLRALGVAREVPRRRVNNDGAPEMIWSLTGKAPITVDVLP